MDVSFEAAIWEWPGPAPYHFVTVPEAQSELIAAASELVTYGWGMVPVTARVGGTEWTTSLWPKDGGYVVPLRDNVRKPEGLSIGDTITVTLSIVT